MATKVYPATKIISRFNRRHKITERDLDIINVGQSKSIAQTKILFHENYGVNISEKDISAVRKCRSSSFRKHVSNQEFKVLAQHLTKREVAVRCHLPIYVVQDRANETFTDFKYRGQHRSGVKILNR